MDITQLKTARYYNLNLTAVESLLTLAKLGSTDMTGLAKEVGVSPGSLTKIADKLAAGGMVARVSSRDDRRVIYLQLTEKGASRIFQITGEHVDLLPKVPAGAAPALGLRYSR